MKAADILRAAADISEERQRVHGRSEDNMKFLAAAWTLWIRMRFPRGDVILQPEDAAMMMAWSKDVRSVLGAVNLDDFVDSAGYRAIAGQVALQTADLADRIVAEANAKKTSPLVPQRFTHRATVLRAAVGKLWSYKTLSAPHGNFRWLLMCSAATLAGMSAMWSWDWSRGHTHRHLSGQA